MKQFSVCNYLKQKFVMNCPHHYLGALILPSTNRGGKRTLLPLKGMRRPRRTNAIHLIRRREPSSRNAMRIPLSYQNSNECDGNGFGCM